MNKQELAELEQVKLKFAENNNKLVYKYDDLIVSLLYDPKNEDVDIELIKGSKILAICYFLPVESVRRLVLNGFTDEEVQIIKSIAQIKMYRTRKAYFKRLFVGIPLSPKEAKRAALLSNAKKLAWENVKDVIPRLFQPGYKKVLELIDLSGFNIVYVKHGDVEMFIETLFFDGGVRRFYDALVISKDVLGIIDCSKCLTVYRLGKLLNGDIEPLKKSIIHEKERQTGFIRRIEVRERYKEIKVYDAELYDRLKTILNYLRLESS